MTIDQISHVCHEANSAYCAVVGDPVLGPWNEIDESYRESTRNGVRGAITGTATPESLHESWLAERTAQGWKFGPTLDREAKIHPNLRPYNELSPSQQRKDAMFLAIVGALKQA